MKQIKSSFGNPFTHLVRTRQSIEVHDLAIDHHAGRTQNPIGNDLRHVDNLVQLELDSRLFSRNLDQFNGGLAILTVRAQYLNALHLSFSRFPSELS